MKSVPLKLLSGAVCLTAFVTAGGPARAEDQAANPPLADMRRFPTTLPDVWFLTPPTRPMPSSPTATTVQLSLNLPTLWNPSASNIQPLQLLSGSPLLQRHTPSNMVPRGGGLEADCLTAHRVPQYFGTANFGTFSTLLRPSLIAGADPQPTMPTLPKVEMPSLGNSPTLFKPLTPGLPRTIQLEPSAPKNPFLGRRTARLHHGTWCG